LNRAEAAGRAFLDQFAQGAQDVLRYVGLQDSVTLLASLAKKRLAAATLSSREPKK